jgi:hypothetical protein
METLIGIAALFVGLGIAWLCFAIGVYFLTRTGREGMRIGRMAEAMRMERVAEERREHQSGDRKSKKSA